MDYVSEGNSRPLELPCAKIVDGELVFLTKDGLDYALNLGAFCLEIPVGLDLLPGIRLCQNFYKPRESGNDRYQGHRDADHSKSKLGYENRPDQVEQLQIESFLWREIFPEDVIVLLNNMKVMTLEILRSLFVASGVRKEDWHIVSGGAGDETGLCYTTVNHYRSDHIGKIGIVEHTDSGFITVIYADQSGYEIFHNGKWIPVKFEPNRFVVNLGDAYQILTRHLVRPGRAVLHRVNEIKAGAYEIDRSSFTVYMGPKFDMMLYQYDKGRTLKEFCLFRNFSMEKAKSMGYRFHPKV